MAYSRLIKLNDSHLMAVFSYNLESNKGVIALLMATVWWLAQRRRWKQNYGSALCLMFYVNDVYIWDRGEHILGSSRADGSGGEQFQLLKGTEDS